MLSPLYLLSKSPFTCLPLGSSPLSCGLVPLEPESEPLSGLLHRVKLPIASQERGLPLAGERLAGTELRLTQGTLEALLVKQGLQARYVML